jgi:hypothetical protein
MAATVQRSESEIDDVRNEVVDLIDEGSSKFPGMSYEEGVENALSWVFGERDESPMVD